MNLYATQARPSWKYDVDGDWEYNLAFTKYQLAINVKRLKATAKRYGLKCWEVLNFDPKQISGKRADIIRELVAIEQILVANDLWDQEVGLDYDLDIQAAWPLVGGKLLSAEFAVQLYRFVNAHNLDICLALQFIAVHCLGSKFLEGERFKRIESDLLWITPKRLERLKIGLEWLGRNRPRILICDVRSLTVISRVKEWMRWALTERRSQMSSSRKLNWKLAKKASQDPKLRFSLMSRAAQWTTLTGEPPALRLTFLEGFKVGTYLRLRRFCREDSPEVRGLTQALFNLVRLLGDEASIRRFVKDSGLKWSAKGLHDAGQFTLPTTGWTPARWAPLCLKFPRAVRYASSFAKLEALGLMPGSLAQLRLQSVQLGYGKVPAEFRALADLMAHHEIPGDEFQMYLKFWKTVKVKPKDHMPALHVEGVELGLPPQWKMIKLDPDSYLGPFLGSLSACCQHLAGAGSSCAEHGVISPFSAFYVIFMGNTVIAQSWAWRTVTGAVVFDSIESLYRKDHLETVAKFYREAANRMLHSPLKVPAVYLGATSSGITSNVMSCLNLSEQDHCETPLDVCSYYDGEYHNLLAGQPSSKVMKVPKVLGYERKKAMPKLVDDNIHGLDLWNHLPVRYLRNLRPEIPGRLHLAEADIYL